MAARLMLVLAALFCLPAELLAVSPDRQLGTSGLAFYKHVSALHQWLGIHPDAAARSRLRFHYEANVLQSIGRDAYGRQHFLAPAAAEAWHAMDQAAREDGVRFLVVSSYRSAEYQAHLIRRRLEEGRAPERVFASIALPGYSEHHSGCAVDLASEEQPQLGAAFRHTRAYEWLHRHAADFGFRESYPRGNSKGIIPEPWHWFHLSCAD
ncbi:M15 family metallopeptidase [Natronospira bacteriovora]|uniref:M15 family metallopeptidase n=1 Tax=Natronospira bacteriovora TaxID=3069753 RepID=A0ABU0W335_9GAMM|nr:M15 family metallopeptidase [Natronospira sp. AB-CW4]MDQ2068418.1 M15 family metallopeptidase [Natronospira sp. AB-CW4]